MPLILSEFGLVVLTVIVLSYLFYKIHSVDKAGMIAANLVGILTYLLGGLKLFIVILAVFIGAEAVTRIRGKSKAGHERRTTANVVGNCSAALICLALQQQTAFFGSVSAALADTFSSEIGMLSKNKPRLITSLKEVETGTDGGISLLGFIASIIGAGIIAGLHFYFFSSIKLVAILIFAGILGSTVDSLLGAIFERKKQLNNMQVNFLASSSGAIAAYVLATVI